jgi:hypothetical protein
MTGVRAVTLPQFLTEAQIIEAKRLYEKSVDDGFAVLQIQKHVIAPNLTAINAKLGQENDPRYLAYAVVFVFNQLADHLLRTEKDGLS